VWRTRGAHAGERWAPLRPATIQWRAAGSNSRSRTKDARGRIRPIGGNHPRQLSGKTKRAWTQPGGESVREFGKNKYTRSSSINHNLFHQLGFTVTRWGRVVFRSPRAVPPRRIIPERMPRAQVGAWETSLANFILQETGGQPFRRFGYGTSRGLP
jgi:hypothetical protein